MNPLRLKLIACDVLLREVCILIARSPHVFDVEFTEKDSHNHSDLLKNLIQDKIDAAQGKNYDAILLGYGLCGNATIGLTAGDTKVVIPRAHDCCTLFLGSKERFKEHFKENPSQPFSSPGYMERSDSPFHGGLEGGDMESDPVFHKYVEQYGEENARYIYETMYGHQSKSGKLVYIEIPETRNPDYADLCRERAKAAGMTFVPIEGSIDLLERLIDGQWNKESFFILEPGHRSVGVYDWDEIIAGDKVDE